MRENAVVIVKPTVMTGDWFTHMSWGGGFDPPPSGKASRGTASVCWGDSVVITNEGPGRLGKIRPEIISVA
jgi:hypothetical protein